MSGVYSGKTQTCIFDPIHTRSEFPKGPREIDAFGDLPIGGSCAEETMVEYMIVIEDAGENFSAYIPDLPGCIFIGVSVEKTTANI